MGLEDLLPALRPVLSEFDQLVWYRKGGETSERQWRDIAGVLKQQQNRLDIHYLIAWADRLQVRDQWERVRRDSDSS